MADSVGDRVGQQLGNYHLLRLLRQESTMDIYLGEHIFLKTQATINVLPEQLSQPTLETFLTETRSIARMKHPNLLSVLEFDVEGKTPFLVTADTSSGSLRQRYPEGAQIPEEVIITYVRQIATALQYLHDQGIVHRRIRPENIVFGPQNRILLSGLGTMDAASTQHARISEEERVIEQKYRAPEQLQGESCPASDQYAVGMIVYEWLSGDTSVRISSSEIQDTLAAKPRSPELVRVIMTALAQDPRQRFANVTIFARELEKQLGPTRDEKIVTGSQTRIEPILAIGRTKRNAACTIGSIFIALILLIGGVFFYNFRDISATSKRTLSVQKTQIVIARGTQQAVATFTAPSAQGIYTVATHGIPFINDPLDDSGKSTWENKQGKTYGCSFSGGVYHVQISSSNTYFLNCLAQKSNFHNFAFETEMSVVQGGNGGIIFRADNTGSKFYAFEISNNNSTHLCRLLMYSGNKVTNLQETISDVNLQDFNSIAVIAYENRIYLYLNHEFLMQVQDNTWRSGALGMYVSNIGSATTDVMFRNAKIWKL